MILVILMILAIVASVFSGRTESDVSRIGYLVRRAANPPPSRGPSPGCPLAPKTRTERAGV